MNEGAWNLLQKIKLGLAFTHAYFSICICLKYSYTFLDDFSTFLIQL